MLYIIVLISQFVSVHLKGDFTLRKNPYSGQRSRGEDRLMSFICTHLSGEYA